MGEIQSPNLDYEVRLGYPKKHIAGVDEAGRGCLAGPVVAAAAILPAKVDPYQHPWLAEIADSKLLDRESREALFPRIQSWVKAWGVGIATVSEIDQINIFHASHLAMERAVQDLNITPAHALVDGKFLPKRLLCESTAVIKGDLKCLSIACASIIAKVYRDQLMVGLDTQYPGYGLASHKGYPTPQHRDALEEKGITDIHRRSFAPVAKYVD